MPKTVEEYRAIADAQAQHRLIADEVFRETNAQLTKWGVQDHPAGNSPDGTFVMPRVVNLDLRTGSELETIFRDSCEDRFKRGRGTYMDILLEEVFEAAGAKTPEEFEAEMVQVAAVAASAVAASRRARGA